MDGDSLVLWLFCVFALASTGAAYLFFIRFRQYKEPFRWSRLVLGNTLIMLLAASLTLLCGEVYYRFLCDDLDSFVMSKITRSWSQRHFKHNELSFRDSIEYSTKTREGWRRVTFLGEAFTVGHGIADVEKRFANRLRKVLTQCEVHVVAEPAWDTGQHLWIASGLPADGFALDLVVLVYSLDDAMDRVEEWQRIQRRINRPGKLKFLVNHSYLINTWYYRTKAARDPDAANFVQLVRDNYGSAVWASQQQRLTVLHETIENFGGRLLVVTMPHLYALGADYPYQQIHAQLGDFWDQRGVPHLDLLPLFAAQRAEDLIISRRNVYPNEKAHELAADAIRTFLEPQLIPTVEE